MRANYLFTSESVSEGHPDKVADQISDAIVDLFLSKDPEARIACETLTTTQLVVLAGEIRCKGVYEDGAWAPGAQEEIEATVRRTVKEIGYEQDGFHWETFRFENNLHGQSVQIAQGVDASGNKDEGAGDQGIMFGYATDETPDLMPAPIQYSHAILRRLAEVRKNGTEPTLGPDAKSQLSVNYHNGKPVGVASIVLSTQHLDEGQSSDDIRKIVEPYILEILPQGWVTPETVWHVNPTGKFVIGGPDGDAGLTGRKIIVDTYGGAAPHGGGAFSGKDPTKVDRSAAYMARWVAKHIVASGAAERCELQVAYAIGHPEPTSIHLDTFGTGEIPDEQILAAVKKVFLFNPAEIIRQLDLRRPIYRASTHYGHFGKKGLPWEITSKLPAFHKALIK